jgi:hypothetical protein
VIREFEKKNVQSCLVEKKVKEIHPTSNEGPQSSSQIICSGGNRKPCKASRFLCQLFTFPILKKRRG